MAKIKLTALRTLSGNYGLVHDGQVFEVEEDAALSLEKRGLAQRYYDPDPPLARFSKKMLKPVENKMMPVLDNKAGDGMTLDVPVLAGSPVPPVLMVTRPKLTRFDLNRGRR